MLDYKTLITEESAFRCYHALVGVLASRDEKPIKVCRIDGEKISTFVFIVQKSTKKIKTYKAEISKVDAPFFTSWIGSDFPEVDFECIAI